MIIVLDEKIRRHIITTYILNNFIIHYDRAFGIYETVLVSLNVAVTQCTLKWTALDDKQIIR